MKQMLISESYNENKYGRNAHSVGISMWEFEWTPKYRYRIFRKWKYMKLTEACIRRAASMWGIKWIELSVQPEHVQGTAEIPLSMSPSQALHKLKGISANLFFKMHPDIRKRYPRGHLWSPGKFAASLGFIQLETAKNYVRNQDIHHALSA